MAYNLQPSKTGFVGGKNILASEHQQNIEGGATLKGGSGLYETGQAIAKVTADGLWVKFVDANVATYEDFAILNVDADASVHNAVVGEVLIRASVYDAKLIGATTAFKAKTPFIRYVKA